MRLDFSKLEEARRAFQDVTGQTRTTPRPSTAKAVPSRHAAPSKSPSRGPTLEEQLRALELDERITDPDLARYAYIQRLESLNGAWRKDTERYVAQLHLDLDEDVLVTIRSLEIKIVQDTLLAVLRRPENLDLSFAPPVIWQLALIAAREIAAAVREKGRWDQAEHITLGEAALPALIKAYYELTGPGSIDERIASALANYGLDSDDYAAVDGTVVGFIRNAGVAEPNLPLCELAQRVEVAYDELWQERRDLILRRLNRPDANGLSDEQKRRIWNFVARFTIKDYLTNGELDMAIDTELGDLALKPANPTPTDSQSWHELFQINRALHSDRQRRQLSEALTRIFNGPPSAFAGTEEEMVGLIQGAYREAGVDLTNPTQRQLVRRIKNARAAITP